VVNTLRDYQAFEGILFPTRVVYDKVGWEAGPNQLVIRDVRIDPEIDEAIFQSSELDFGEVLIEGDTVRGEVRAIEDGTALTNVSLSDLSEIGVQVTEWVEVSLGSTRRKVKVLDNIQASAALIRPDEIYLCMYPFSGCPRLMLMTFGQDVLDNTPCAKGDTFVLKKCPPLETGSMEVLSDEEG